MNDRYDFGFSDPRMEHGSPHIKWEPITISAWTRIKEVLPYIMLALSGSMMLAPMAWVQLIKWVLA